MGISLLLLFSLAQLVKQSEMQHARRENQKANLLFAWNKFIYKSGR